MAKPYQCIIFDWDGTLMNSEARIVASIQTAAERAGFPVLPYDVSKQIIGLSLEKAILTLYPEADKGGVQSIATGYSDYFLTESEVPMLPFEGAEKMLQKFKSEGVQLAIATGKSRRGLDQVLSEVGFGHYFDITRTPVESESKPSPLMLKQILEILELEVSQAVMVGDTEFDMEMAQNIGMDRIALGHGVHELHRLEQYNPVASFHGLKELQDWLLS